MIQCLSQRVTILTGSTIGSKERSQGQFTSLSPRGSISPTFCKTGFVLEIFESLFYLASVGETECKLFCFAPHGYNLGLSVMGW